MRLGQEQGQRRGKTIRDWTCLAIISTSFVCCRTPAAKDEKASTTIAVSKIEVRPLEAKVTGKHPNVGVDEGDKTVAATKTSTEGRPALPAREKGASPALTQTDLAVKGESAVTEKAPVVESQTTQAKPQAKSGVRFGTPRVMGDLDAKAVSKFVWGKAGSVDGCRRAQAEEVRVQLLVQLDGRVAIAQPDPTQPHGDTEVARCVAKHMRSNIPGGSNGIAFVKVSLPAKD